MKNITSPPITEKESRQMIADMNSCADKFTREFLSTYRDWHGREGWRAIGYESQEACMKANEIPFLNGAGRSTAFMLLNQAEVLKNTGKVVPIKAAQPISKLPPEEQAPALREAAEAGGGKPTVAAVAAVVATRQAATPLEKADKPAPKLEESVERIGKVCGTKVAKALRDGSLSNVKPRSITFWASLKDHQMLSILELVVTKRWAPEKAWKFMSKVPGEKTTVGDLQLLAISSGGATLLATGAFATICYGFRGARTEVHAKIKKLLGLD